MNIVVTGASKGIGFETVKAFAAEDGNNIIAISRNEELLLKLKSDCDSYRSNSIVHILPTDLETDDLTTTFSNQFGGFMKSVDILINNVGLLINKPFTEFSEADFDRIFGVNVKSVFRLTQFLIPYLNPGAHIVNISSMGGFQGSSKFSGLSLYSASKGALAILTECLAEELKDRDIRVNCLAIGAVQTEMLAMAFPGYKAPVNSEQMALFIKNFAENSHHFLNGKIIPVSLSTP